MPMTPDMPDDEITPQPGKTGSDGTRRDTANKAARMAANEAPDDDPLDDLGDIYESGDEEDLEDAPGQTFSDMVRGAPVGAVIGAFIAGFLVSRLI